MLICILCLTESETQANDKYLDDSTSLEAVIRQHFSSFVEIIFEHAACGSIWCCATCTQALDDFDNFFNIIQSRHLKGSREDVEPKYIEVCVSEDLEICETLEVVQQAYLNKKAEFLTIDKPSSSRKVAKPKAKIPKIAKEEFTLELFPKVYRRRTALDEKKIMESVEMKCDLCNQRLESFAEAQSHYRDVHSQKGYLTCCSRKFTQKSSLIDHLAFHSNPLAFQCKLCEKNLTCFSNLRTHVLLMHIPQTRFQCDTCGKFLNCKYRLTSHLKRHISSRPSKEVFPCFHENCSKSFNNKTALKSHQNSCHNPNRETFWCEMCGKELKSKNSLKEHITNTHGEDRSKIECVLCGHFIKNEYAMKKHLNRHKQMEQNITCEHCGKKCTTKAALRSHVRMKHLLQRNLPCRFCDKKFKQQIDVQEHEATHSGVDLYFCLWCPATFKFGANFRAHRKNFHPEEYEKIKPAWLRPN